MTTVRSDTAYIQHQRLFASRNHNVNVSNTATILSMKASVMIPPAIIGSYHRNPWKKRELTPPSSLRIHHIEDILAVCLCCMLSCLPSQAGPCSLIRSVVPVVLLLILTVGYLNCASFVMSASASSSSASRLQVVPFRVFLQGSWRWTEAIFVLVPPHDPCVRCDRIAHDSYTGFGCRVIHE